MVSAKLKLVKTVPRGERVVASTLTLISPRREAILTNFPSVRPQSFTSSGWISRVSSQSAEFVEDVLGGFVFEAGGAEAFGDFGNDPPVGFGIAITWDGGAEALDPAFGVSLHSVGLAPGGGWEDDVGHLRGLGEEDVDDDEVVERLQGFLAVVFIGVGDDGVFAIDEHGMDAIFFQAAEIERGDLGHGIAKVEVGLLVGGPEFLVGFLGNDRLEAGVVVGDGSAVACALDVVLPAHRVDSGAYLTEVAGEEGEVAE